MTLRIFLVYVLFLQLFWSTTAFHPLLRADINVVLLLVTTTILLITNISNFTKKKYFGFAFIYIIAIGITFVMNSLVSMHSILRLMSPIVIFYTMQPKDLKYYKPIFWTLIVFFILNCGIAIYEKMTMSYYLAIDPNDEIMQAQQGGMIYTYGEEGFRAFSLIGHPLNNGNIMAYMSFIIYLTSHLNMKLRICLLSLGMASLFCFNTRGAILISALLLIPTVWDFIKNNKGNRFIAFLAVLIAVCLLVVNFDKFGGRLMTGSLDDDSSMVRVYSIKEFLSLTFEQFLFGGHLPKYGENGYIMVIEVYGAIIGLIKIFFEMFFSYKSVGINSSKKNKWIVMLSLIAVGSTNNNLFFAKVFPFYVLCIIFISHYSKYLRHENPLRL